MIQNLDYVIVVNLLSQKELFDSFERSEYLYKCRYRVRNKPNRVLEGSEDHDCSKSYF